MRISDWSSDVCSSDLSVPVPDRAGRPTAAGAFLIWWSAEAPWALRTVHRTPGWVHLLANDIAGPSAAFGIEHHGCEGGENIADAVAGVRWTAGRRRGGRRLHGWHALPSAHGRA